MIQSGSTVQWKWGNGKAKGEVQEVYKEEVTMEFDGAEVTRRGSDDNPAYLIKQENGQCLLKLSSEVEHLKS